MYIPDKTILKDLVDAAEKEMYPPMAYMLGVERVLTYVLQFDEFILSDTNAAHVLRQVAKSVELLIMKFTAEGSLDVNKAFVVGEIVGNVLAITSHVEEFDDDSHYAHLTDILSIISTDN